MVDRHQAFQIAQAKLAEIHEQVQQQRPVVPLLAEWGIQLGLGSSFNRLSDRDERKLVNRMMWLAKTADDAIHRANGTLQLALDLDNDSAKSPSSQ
jgi:hypothetical protein